MNKAKSVLKAVWTWFLGLGKWGKAAVIMGLLTFLIIIIPGGDSDTPATKPVAAAQTTEAPSPAVETTEPVEATQEPVEATTEPVEEVPDLLERANEAGDVASEYGLDCADAVLPEETAGNAASVACAAGDQWLSIIYTQDREVQDVLFDNAMGLWEEEVLSGTPTWDFYTVDGVEEQLIFMGTDGVLLEIGAAIEGQMSVATE